MSSWRMYLDPPMLADDRFEENDDRETATLLTEGSYQEFSHCE